ncbi:MAG TPA: hypothetical protein VK459_03660 [Polyangiaceae bacterium]|nr:hypothetical protein [Polyangiaceae bacterium]
MPETTAVCLTTPATHVDVRPGEEIILRGSFYSKHDGATIDAATTSWPAEAPGGASIDSGGLIDFTGGGFHVTSRNAATHEVHAVATGDPAPLCAQAGVEAPCLPLRLLPLARSRFMTVNEWGKTLVGGPQNGCLAMEVPARVLPPVPPGSEPYLKATGAALGLAAVAALAWVIQRRRAASPAGQLNALAQRVRGKLKAADPVIAAPLAPAIESVLKAIRERKVDAPSAEGKRVATVLRRVEAQLSDAEARARAEEEQQAADELVREVESALEAAEEATAIDRRAAR